MTIVFTPDSSFLVIIKFVIFTDIAITVIFSSRMFPFPLKQRLQESACLLVDFQGTVLLQKETSGFSVCLRPCMQIHIHKILWFGGRRQLSDFWFSCSTSHKYLNFLNLGAIRLNFWFLWTLSSPDETGFLSSVWWKSSWRECWFVALGS